MDETQKVNLITVEDAMGRSRWGGQYPRRTRPKQSEEGHIPGATWIPFGYLEGRLSEVPRTSLWLSIVPEAIVRRSRTQCSENMD
jgi:3-mercaptopyruvate sulfurtransferase SseA